MVIVLALALAAGFGAGDQYLGSLAAYPWGAEVSLLSAPWLVLAFFAGMTQREPGRAALLGLGCTYAALLGYGLMTLSPLENAHYSLAGATTFVGSEGAVVVGGLVTGPAFGWLGQQWRTRRVLAGALLVAAMLCLEPLVRTATVDRIRFPAVWLAEVAAGFTLAGLAVARRHAGGKSAG